MPETIEMIELESPEVPPIPEVVTVEEAKAAELSAEEIEMGKKTGLFVDKKKDEPDAEEKKEVASSDSKENSPAPVEKKLEQKLKPWEKDISDEDQSQLEKFSPNEKALYWKQKKEKYRRQELEAERDQLRIQTNYWKGKAEAFQEAGNTKVATAPSPDPARKDGEGEDIFNENGEKPDEKPLTKADLERYEQEKALEAEKQRKAQEDKRVRTMTVLNEQENRFKQDHDDFNDVFALTKDILERAPDEDKLKELFPDPLQRRGVRDMARELMVRMVNAEKLDASDTAIPELAYELGKLHPKTSNADDENENGKMRDEGSKSLEKRLEREGRPSSAPLSGGSSRAPKSVNDLTAEDLVNMPTSQFAKLKKAHPEVVDRILREG